ncbi:MAG TPA: hypothetical protein PK546_05790, partial [Chitinophagales bacterium]|nr:hypothetical protein [Chitinophagales bacterium]
MNPFFKIFLLLSFFLLDENVKGDDCFPSQLTFVNLNRQGQIDSFDINYPGCTQISGRMFISGT